MINEANVLEMSFGFSLLDSLPLSTHKYCAGDVFTSRYPLEIGHKLAPLIFIVNALRAHEQVHIAGIKLTILRYLISFSQQMRIPNDSDDALLLELKRWSIKSRLLYQDRGYSAR